MGNPVLPSIHQSIHTMKNLLLILGIISLGFFSACGGGHDHECCGECCKGGDDAKEAEASE